MNRIRTQIYFPLGRIQNPLNKLIFRRSSRLTRTPHTRIQIYKQRAHNNKNSSVHTNSESLLNSFSARNCFGQCVEHDWIGIRRYIRLCLPLRTIFCFFFASCIYRLLPPPHHPAEFASVFSETSAHQAERSGHTCIGATPQRHTLNKLTMWCRLASFYYFLVKWKWNVLVSPSRLDEIVFYMRDEVRMSPPSHANFTFNTPMWFIFRPMNSTDIYLPLTCFRLTAEMYIRSNVKFAQNYSWYFSVRF